MRWRNPIITVQFLATCVLAGTTSFGQDPGQERQAPPQQAEAARAGAAPANPEQMEWILKQWEHQSSLLKSLDVRLLRIDDTPAWGDREYYEGRALFQAPNLALIDFNKVTLDENKKPVKDAKGNFVSSPFERIVCTGDEVWQYRSDSQQIFIFPLQKDQQKKAIEEGPLPFLFNMRGEDAKQRYQMTLMTVDQKTGTYGISIKPKLKEDRDSFSLAFVNLDQKYLLPTRIIMLSPDGKSKKDFQIDRRNTFPNKPINPGNFQGKPLGPPWKVVRNPAGEERPRAMSRVRRGAAPAGPAAAAPGDVSARRQ
jgi:TIGR03009 family protein